MPNIIEINDIQDPALDVYARLTSHQLRRCHDLFIAETPKVILSALDAGCIPESILMERKKLDGAAKEILERCEGIPVYTADREVLSELTGFALTRSILCAMHNPDLPSCAVPPHCGWTACS